MKVWVIMGNDFPDGAVSSLEKADEVCNARNEESKRRAALPYGHADRQGRIYWRHYEYELDAIQP